MAKEWLAQRESEVLEFTLTPQKNLALRGFFVAVLLLKLFNCDRL